MPSTEILTLLHRGKQSNSLFLMPDVCGSLEYIATSLPLLDQELSIFGWSPTQGGNQSRTVEGLASHVVAAIENSNQPEPYRVLGWGFGGVLAYEVAAQLIGRNATIDFVGMIDTVLFGGNEEFDPLTGPSKPARNELEDVLALLELVRHKSQLDPANANDGERQSLRAWTQQKLGGTELNIEQILKLYRDKAVLPRQLVDLPAGQLIEQVRTLRRWKAAHREYAAEPLPITVHLFTASSGNVKSVRQGWKEAVGEGTLRTVEVAGDHYTMLHQPNAKSLAQALCGALAESKGKHCRAEVQGTPVFLLHERKLTHHAAPLLCVPGAGDSPASFIELSRSFEIKSPVFAIQHRGLDTHTVPFSSVEAAAASYIRALQQTYPEGPIRLLGHSFGGWIAFEMALLIEATGSTVESLTILDSEPPTPHNAPIPEYNRAEALLQLVDAYEQVLGHSLDISREDLDGLNHCDQIAYIHRRLVSAGLLPIRFQKEGLKAPIRTFCRSIRVSYTPRRAFYGNVQFLAAANPRNDCEANVRRYLTHAELWRVWAPNLTSMFARGNHMTMLKEPNVSALANQITMGTLHKPKAS